MKAVKITAPGVVELVDRAPGTLESGQVRVAVRLCGIGESDLARYRGLVPGVLPAFAGDEMVGEVVESRSDLLARGDRVVGCVADAMAQEVVVEARHLRRVPPGVDDPAAVLARPLAGAMKAVADAEIQPGQHVVVIGTGPIGLLVTKVAAVREPKTLVAVGRSRDGLERARRHGAHALFFGNPEQIGRGIRAIIENVEGMGAPGGRLAHAVIETTGVQAGIDAAVKAVAPQGRIVVGGHHHGTRSWPEGYLTAGGIHRLAGHLAPGAVDDALWFMEKGMDMVAAGDLPGLEGLVTEVPLDRAREAFTHANGHPGGRRRPGWRELLAPLLSAIEARPANSADDRVPAGAEPRQSWRAARPVKVAVRP